MMLIFSGAYKCPPQVDTKAANPDRKEVRDCG